jgi:hypothetical protein
MPVLHFYPILTPYTRETELQCVGKYQGKGTSTCNVNPDKIT